MGAAPKSSPVDPLQKVLAELAGLGCEPELCGQDEYKARCPCHMGSRKNFSVGIGDDGRVVCFCHREENGRACTFEDICLALGMTASDFFAESPSPRRKRSAKAVPRPANAIDRPKKKKVAKDSPILHAEYVAKKDGRVVTRGYRYQLADGTPHFNVYRLDNPTDPEDKSYLPVRYDPEEKVWYCGDPLVGLLSVYRRPEIALASDVWIGEGEKCADIFTALGFQGTTTAHGNGAPQKSDLTPLAGKRVVISPDNDEPGEGYLAKLLPLLAKLSPPPQVKVVRLPGLEKGGDIQEFCEARGLTSDDFRNPEDGLAEKVRAIREEIEAIESGIPWASPRELMPAPTATGPRLAIVTGDGDEDGPPPRPLIEVNTERHRVVDEAIEAIRADATLYSRAEALVTVVRETEDEKQLSSKIRMKGLKGSPRVVELSDAIVSCVLTRNCEFFSWKKDRKGEDYSAPAHPPDWLIKAVATRKHWPGIRPLEAVTECPFPRPDGTIVEAPGYDPETATLFIPTFDVPPLAERPTQDDARAAAERLFRFVDKFPFPTEDDRVVILAGMLTVIGRPAIRGSVPGIAINGNKAGIGKGLLVNAMAIPGIGRAVPVSSYPETDEEATKVKVAIVLGAQQVHSFDNLREGSTYGGSVIDAMLTSKTTNERIIGTARSTGEMPVRAVFFANGNNIAPAKDAFRRWLVCNLVTDLEHPERREDLGDEEFEDVILAHRPQMVRDALTILKAHALAGRPTAGWPRLGSFGEWDRVVRAAVWFSTGRDCSATQIKAADESPDHLGKIALLDGWRELPGGKAGQGGVTAHEALQAVEDMADRYHTLRAELLQRGRGGKLPDSSRLGAVLRALKNVPVGHLKLKETPYKRHKVTCWIVDDSGSYDTTHATDSEGGCRGYGGPVSNPRTQDFRSHNDVMAHSDEVKRYEDGLESAPPSPLSPPKTTRREVEL